MGRRTLFLAVWATCGCSGSGKDEPADDLPSDTEDSTLPPEEDTDTGTAETGTPIDPDADGDGFGAEADCDDTDASVYPGAPDICGDQRVTDCDRTSDEGLISIEGVGHWSDLGEALAAAPAGSDIVVCPGTYVGSFVAPSPVRLHAPAGPQATVLSGGGTGPVLVLPGDSQVEGFTVRDGDGTIGGGIVQSSAGTLRVDRCLVTANAADQGGGLALAEEGAAIVSMSTIFGNTARVEGGGLWIPAGAAVDLADSVIVENTAVEAGGGASVVDGAVDGGSFMDNECLGATGGGGMALSGTTVVRGAYFEFNTAVQGGGLYIRDLALLDDVYLNENAAVQETAEGGGIYCDGCALEMVSTVLYGNTSEYRGGGIAVHAGVVTGPAYVERGWAPYGGGLYATASELGNLELWEDEAVFGGGAYVADGISAGSDLVFDGCVAEQGGGLVLQDAELSILGGAFVRNVADEGGGAHLLGASAFSVEFVDFGQGTEANLPGDVFAGGTELGGYGPGANFSCDTAGCSVP